MVFSSVEKAYNLFYVVFAANRLKSSGRRRLPNLPLFTVNDILHE